MKTKVSITGFWQSGNRGFVLTKTINTAKWQPGSVLTKAEVEIAIAEEVQVTAIARSKA